MDGSYRVRVAEEADLAAVAALSRAWAEEGITWGLVPTPAEALRERLRATFLVATQAAHVIGYAHGRTMAAGGDAVFPPGVSVFALEELYVAPSHRSRGVGGALLDAVLAAARAQGVGHFTVSSATRATDSIIRFYAAHGFQVWSVQLYRSE